MSVDPEILIGMEILGKYIVCFDGNKKRIGIRKVCSPSECSAAYPPGGGRGTG